jgi:hypothetical protein
LEVPVLIFSAGIGDVVEEMLSQRLALHDGVPHLLLIST